MMKTAAAKPLSIVIAVALLLAMLGSGVSAYGTDTAQGREDVADWTILGLDVPGYANRAQQQVPLEERRWIRHYKLEIRWGQVQPQRGVFDWSFYDQHMEAILADGCQSMLLVLTGPVPKWARDASFGGFADRAPPADLRDWYGFCAEAAAHYGPVVDFYEIWNEPGWDMDGEAYRLFGTYHFGGQVETDYLPLLQLGYEAIREKDPSGLVICGSLLDTLVDDPNVGTGLYTYLFDDTSRPHQQAALTVKAESGITAKRTLRPSCVREGLLPGGLMGIYAGRTEWFFADGCTRSGCDMWLYLDNREAEEASVTIDYYCGDGSMESRSIVVPPRTRLSIPVFEEGLGTGRHDTERGDISVALTSNRPILAERSIYFNQGGGSNGQAGPGEKGPPRTEWRLEDGKYTIQENVCMLNAGEKAVSVKVESRRPDGSSEDRSVELEAGSRTMLPVDSGGQAQGPGGLSVKVYCDEPIVAELSPRFLCDGPCEGEYTSPGVAAPNRQWEFTQGHNSISTRDSIYLHNPGKVPVQADLTFEMAKGQVLNEQVLMQPVATTLVDGNAILGFVENCDMVAVHPYRSPGNWGPFYSNLVRTMGSIGVDKEIAVTEIGWLHYKDDQPEEFDEQEQADAMGSWGIGPLREAGCRKMWVYKDMDERPGKSWDKCYFGLFDYEGNPHPAWQRYKEWQNASPAYPLLPSSLP